METIYSITSTKGDKVYIGRTKHTLTKRKRFHKSKSNNCNSKILFNEYGSENCIFTALEECMTDQASERELYYIQHTDCVNLMGKWTGTKKEYNKAYGKARYEANKEAINERNKAYYEANRDAILASQKAYIEANREAINEKRRISRQAKK